MDNILALSACSLYFSVPLTAGHDAANACGRGARHQLFQIIWWELRCLVALVPYRVDWCGCIAVWFRIWFHHPSYGSWASDRLQALQARFFENNSLGGTLLMHSSANASTIAAIIDVTFLEVIVGSRFPMPQGLFFAGDELAGAAACLLFASRFSDAVRRTSASGITVVEDSMAKITLQDLLPSGRRLYRDCYGTVKMTIVMCVSGIHAQ